MFEGWTSPFAGTEQQTQDRNTAWDAIKNDPGTAALIAGLSMLSNNNGSRSLGQIVGRAGFDTLAGLGSMEAQRRAQERQVSLDAERKQYRDMQIQGMQAVLDEQNRRRELQQRFASGDESALKELDPLGWWKNEQAKQQAYQALRNSMALAKYQADLNAGNKWQYDSNLGGYVNPTGEFRPVNVPEGYKPHTVTKAMPFDQASKLAGIESSYQNIQKVALGLFDENGKFKRGTSMASWIPGTDEAEYEKQALQAAESWLRAMTGAAVTRDEIEKYTSMYLPKPWDSEQVVLDKLSRLEDNYVKTLENMGLSSRIQPSIVDNIKQRRSKGNKGDIPPLPSGAHPLNF